MAKRKKRNNIVQHRDWFYCRLRWYNEFNRQVECKVNLVTKNEQKAIIRAKRVLKDIEYIKNGTLQRFQFDDWFEFRNDEDISELIEMTLEVIIPWSLRFQADEIKDHFPSLIPIIENMENMQKNAIRGTKIRGTIYSNDNKLLHSHRE